eukprot:2303511-Prymnesium_polylepis.1
MKKLSTSVMMNTVSMSTSNVSHTPGSSSNASGKARRRGTTKQVNSRKTSTMSRHDETNLPSGLRAACATAHARRARGNGCEGAKHHAMPMSMSTSMSMFM